MAWRLPHSARVAPLRLMAAVCALAGGVWLASVPLAAAPDYPAFTAPVVDAAHVLQPDDIDALTRQLTDLQTKTGTQFAVATVPSLDGEEIEPYANELFRQWKLGKKDVNNGLLLLVAPKEHRLRFEVGYGLEGTMTDLQANLIIRNVMVPKFKAGDIPGAIKAGVDDAIKVLNKDPTAISSQPVAAADEPVDTMTLFLIGAFVIVVLIMVWRSRRRGGSGWAWGPGIGGASSWSSGNDDSGGGGGGFSGGGGGDSGGGGSSGSW